MKTPNSDTPALMTSSLIEAAAETLPGDWLQPIVADTSAHWRLVNEQAIQEADIALRALFLIAYRKCSEAKPTSGDLPKIISLGSIDFSKIPSRRQSCDQRYGEGFYKEARAHSTVLVDRAPRNDPTELLSGLSEFLRFDTPNLSSQRGVATRVLEGIWEDMNVGWHN